MTTIIMISLLINMDEINILGTAWMPQILSLMRYGKSIKIISG